MVYFATQNMEATVASLRQLLLTHCARLLLAELFFGVNMAQINTIYTQIPVFCVLSYLISGGDGDKTPIIYKSVHQQ